MDRVDQLPKGSGLLEPLDCGYRNTSDQMVILRCCGPEEFYLERVVFPFEVLTFSCPAASSVDIWTHGLGGPELVETLRADELVLTAPSPGAAREMPYGETPWLEVV